MAKVILGSLIAFLGVKGEYTIDLESWDAVVDDLPTIGDATVKGCAGDSLTWAVGYGGDGGLYQDPMHAVLVHEDADTNHELCGTKLMVRATKNTVDLDTQHFYVNIAGFVRPDNTDGAALNSLLLPNLSGMGDHPHIPALVTTHLCRSTCAGTAEFEVLEMALPTGMVYYAGGSTGTECEDGEASDDDTVSGVTARELVTIEDVKFTGKIDQACYKFFDLKGSEDEKILVQVTHHTSITTSGPYTFRINDHQLGLLCGDDATPEYTNRVPFECRIVATETIAPPEEATTTTTTTEAATTTTTTTPETTEEAATTTTTTTPGTTEEEGPRELGFCDATSIPVDEGCTKSTFEYAESISPEDAEICSYWPSTAGCGKEDKPCPMIAQNHLVREGDTEERAQCGDVVKITHDGRSIYGQVVIHGKENDEWDPYFRIAGQGWENICPFSCKERTNLKNNCFANESECADFGGVNPGPWSVCACAKNACIDDWGHHPLSKRNSEEAFETCEIDDCCSSCIDQPASTHRLNEGGWPIPIWMLRLRYEWVRKDEGSNTIQAGAAAVAAALCAF